MLVHYFVTALKPVSLDEPAPIRIDDFMHRAHDALSGSVLSDLQQLALYLSIVERQRSGGALFGELWWSYWQGIKTTSASRFLKKLADALLDVQVGMAILLSSPKVVSDELPGLAHDELMEKARMPTLLKLKQALEHGDPYVLERALVVSLFQVMDDIADGDTFSSDQIFVYFLKLLMVTRLQSFSEPQGNEHLMQFITAITEQARHA